MMRYIMMLLMSFFLASSLTVPVLADWEPKGVADQKVEEINENLSEFETLLKTLNNGFIGFTILTAILTLIYHFVKMSTSKGPVERHVAMRGIGTVLICLLLLGGLELLLNLILYIALR